MASFLRQAWNRLRGPTHPMVFPSRGYEIVVASQKLEEELFDFRKAGRYYAVNIGDIGFFTEDGKWCADFLLVEGLSLEMLEENLDGQNKALFIKFIRSMLQWRPEDRKTAKELLQDLWLNSAPSS